MPQSVARLRLLRMTVEERDNDDEERDNPVESDDDFDCVLDTLQRDLEVDVASVCPAAADAPHFGRVAVQATQRQASESVTKRPRLFVSPTATNHPIGRSDCQQEVSNSGGHAKHEILVGPPVARNPAENNSESDRAPRACVKFHVEDDWSCCRESVVWVWFRRIPSPLQVKPCREQTLHHRDAL